MAKVIPKENQSILNTIVLALDSRADPYDISYQQCGRRRCVSVQRATLLGPCTPVHRLGEQGGAAEDKVAV